MAATDDPEARAAMVHETVIEHLKRLGLSGYEAKAYVAMVAAGEPLNGYEVAKRSGVPRSTVYETISKLVARGAAYEVNTGDDVTAYLPLPPKSLLDRMNREFTESLGTLERALPEIVVPPRASLIHSLGSREALLDRALDLAFGARDEIFVSVWPEELALLQGSLKEAEARGVDVSSVVFGTEPVDLQHSYLHEFSSPQVVLENLGCRLFVLTADRRQAVVGGFVGDGGIGIYTDDTAVVLLAAEYVRHDIAIQLLGHHLDASTMVEYWQNDPEMQRLRSDRGLMAAALAGADPLRRPGAARVTARKPAKAAPAPRKARGTA